MSNDEQALMSLRPEDGQVSLVEVPTNIAAAISHAKMLIRSELVPRDYRGKLANAYTAIAFGAQFGMKPMQSLQRIAVINGRPSVWGDAMLGIVENTGELKEFEETELLDSNAKVVGAQCSGLRIRRDGTKRRRTTTFTIDDAKTGGLWNKQGPWQTSPRRMLQLRARAFFLRDTFADVLSGLYSVEEARDIPALDAEVIATEEMPQPKRAAPAPDSPAAAVEADGKQLRTEPTAAQPEQPAPDAAPDSDQAPPAPDSPAAAKPPEVRAAQSAGPGPEAAPPAQAEPHPKEDWLGDGLPLTEQPAASQPEARRPAPAPAREVEQPLVSQAQRGQLLIAAGKSGCAIVDILKKNFGVSEARDVRAADYKKALELLS